MVGVALRRMRVNAGLTQADLAELCGVVQSTVGRWERGDTVIPADKIEILADALGVSVVDIREIRSAESDTEEGGSVSSRMDVYRWRNAVARSQVGVEAKAVLSALPIFLDEESWVITVTSPQFASETGISVETMARAWAEVMESGYVESMNPHLEWVLKLVFP